MKDPIKEGVRGVRGAVRACSRGRCVRRESGLYIGAKLKLYSEYRCTPYSE